MPRNIEMQNFAAPVLDDEEAVQQFEGDGRHGEEIEGHNHFLMILQKCPPLFPRIAPPPDAPQIASDAAFGDDEAEPLKLSMNLGRTPIRIFFRQAADQRSNFFGDLGPATTGPGAPTPVKAKAGAMPADDGLRLYDDQNVGPAGPEATQSRPEKPVEPVQFGPRPFAFEDGELLSQRQDFDRGVAPAAQENAECGNEGED